MWYKEQISNELYVYFNGSLVYKRWIAEGYGMVFDKNPTTTFICKGRGE